MVSVYTDLPFHSWFDADTIVLNNNIPWVTFLPRENSFPDVHFIASRDWDDLDYGVFFVRVNQWSIKFLTQVATFPQSRPDAYTIQDIDIDAMWWALEQPENVDPRDLPTAELVQRIRPRRPREIRDIRG